MSQFAFGVHQGLTSAQEALLLLPFARAVCPLGSMLEAGCSAFSPFHEENFPRYDFALLSLSQNPADLQQSRLDWDGFGTYKIEIPPDEHDLALFGYFVFLMFVLRR
jgi:hypothetical protein